MLFCTCLPQASTRWVLVTLSSLCPLFQAVPLLNLSYIKGRPRMNPGLLGERQVCYLCAMQPLHFFLSFAGFPQPFKGPRRRGKVGRSTGSRNIDAVDAGKNGRRWAGFDSLQGLSPDLLATSKFVIITFKKSGCLDNHIKHFVLRWVSHPIS